MNETELNAALQTAAYEIGALRDIIRVLVEEIDIEIDGDRAEYGYGEYAFFHGLGPRHLELLSEFTLVKP